MQLKLSKMFRRFLLTILLLIILVGFIEGTVYIESKLWDFIVLISFIIGMIILLFYFVGRRFANKK